MMKKRVDVMIKDSFEIYLDDSRVVFSADQAGSLSQGVRAEPQSFSVRRISLILALRLALRFASCS